MAGSLVAALIENYCGGKICPPELVEEREGTELNEGKMKVPAKKVLCYVRCSLSQETKG